MGRSQGVTHGTLTPDGHTSKLHTGSPNPISQLFRFRDIALPCMLQGGGGRHFFLMGKAEPDVRLR